MVETNKSDSSALRTVLGSFSSRHIGLNEKEKKDVILVDQNFKYSHIYIKNFTTEVDTNKSERFTEGNYDINGFDWHPQGTKIVFSHRPEPTYNSGFGSGDISLLELATKEVKSIVHCHSVCATAVSSFQKPIPAFHYMIAIAGGNDIKCAKYGIFGSKKLFCASSH